MIKASFGKDTIAAAIVPIVLELLVIRNSLINPPSRYCFEAE